MSRSDGLGAGVIGDKRYRVSVFPMYERDSGDMCAYEESESLAEAMREAGRLAELWLKAPAEDGEDDRQPVAFDVTVELPH